MRRSFRCSANRLPVDWKHTMADRSLAKRLRLVEKKKENFFAASARLNYRGSLIQFKIRQKSNSYMRYGNGIDLKIITGILTSISLAGFHWIRLSLLAREKQKLKNIDGIRKEKNSCLHPGCTDESLSVSLDAFIRLVHSNKTNPFLFPLSLSIFHPLGLLLARPTRGKIYILTSICNLIVFVAFVFFFLSLFLFRSLALNAEPEKKNLFALTSRLYCNLYPPKRTTADALHIIVVVVVVFFRFPSLVVSVVGVVTQKHMVDNRASEHLTFARLVVRRKIGINNGEKKKRKKNFLFAISIKSIRSN